MLVAVMVSVKTSVSSNPCEMISKEDFMDVVCLGHKLRKVCSKLPRFTIPANGPGRVPEDPRPGAEGRLPTGQQEQGLLLRRRCKFLFLLAAALKLSQ